MLLLRFFISQSRINEEDTCVLKCASTVLYLHVVLFYLWSTNATSVMKECLNSDGATIPEI